MEDLAEFASPLGERTLVGLNEEVRGLPKVKLGYSRRKRVHADFLLIYKMCSWSRIIF